MRSSQNKVKEFHVCFDIPVAYSPTNLTDDAKQRRMNLINEETAELYVNMLADNLVGVADGLADLLYVVLGTAVEYGIDIEPIFNEVHRSNMTKVGGTKRYDGKWIKPSNYSPADIESLLKIQMGPNYA